MRKRIPPPLVMLIFAVFMFATSAFLPKLRFTGSPIPYLGDFVILSGILFLVYAGWCFRKKKTTVNPLNLNKSTALVTDGPFRISRNPMYLGMMLLLVGCAIKTAHLLNIIWVWGFIFYMTHRQIKPEEIAMERLFGEEYRQYKNRVRRWI